jgi:hypothetical protein
MTDDDAAIREVTRMHGFSNMTTVLGSFPEDEEVVLLVSFRPCATGRLELTGIFTLD